MRLPASFHVPSTSGRTDPLFCSCAPSLGPLLVSQKKRNTVKRAKLDIRKEKRAEPEAVVKDSTKKDANESSTLTHKCEEWLVDAFTAADKENRQMSFFEFVVNPESFSQTVENIFYLSFVINKGLAAREWFCLLFYRRGCRSDVLPTSF